MIYGADEYLAAWVSSMIPEPHPTFGHCKVIGTEVDGKLAGAVVYHEYHPEYSSINMSIASVNKRWLSRSALRAFFEFPFGQLGCERISVIVASRNQLSRKLAEGIGFKQEGVLRKAFGADDAIVYGMLKDECRWIKGMDHGQKFRRIASSAT